MIVKDLKILIEGANTEYNGLAFGLDDKFVKDADCTLIERQHHVTEYYGNPPKRKLVSKYTLYFPEIESWRIYKVDENRPCKASDLLDSVHYGSTFKFMGVMCMDEDKIKRWERKGIYSSIRQIGFMKRLDLVKCADESERRTV